MDKNGDDLKSVDPKEPLAFAERLNSDPMHAATEQAADSEQWAV